MTDDRLYTLIDKLYAAALQPERCQDFVEALSEALGGPAIFLAHQLPGLPVPLRSCRVHLRPIPDSVLMEVYQKGLPFFDGSDASLRSGFVPMSDVMDVDELASSDFAAEWMVSQGLNPRGGFGHTFGVEGGDGVAALVIFERNGCRALGSDDLALCNLLAPHLANSYLLQRRIGDEQHERLALGEVVNRLPIGIVLLDREQHPVFTNRTADRIIALDDGFSLGPEGLHAANAHDDASLQKVFDDIIWGRRSTKHGEVVLAVSRPSGKRAFPVIVGKLHEVVNGTSTEDAAISVIFGVPEAGQGISPEALQSAYELTPAESELVGLLAEGLSLREAASRRGVSLNTVRTQIKHVFAKTETNRQGALIRLVLTGAASFPRSDE